MTLFFSDIRFALRTLARSPGFTLAAMVAIALGIGVNSMMFTIYNAAMFKSLPFENPRQIVHIHTRNLVEGWDGHGTSYEDFLEYRQRARSFTGLAAYMDTDFTLTDESGAAQQVAGYLVTPNTFSLIGQKPLLGRDFMPDDDRPEKGRVALISYSLWQTSFGGDPLILGKSVRLNAEPYTVIGVMPKGVEFPRLSKVWIPAVDTAQNRSSWGLRFGFSLIARLPDAVSLTQSQAELSGIAARIGASRPQSGRNVEPVVLPYVEWEIRPKEKLLARTMMGAVSFVLLIACSNVANLLLSRAVQRSREVSIRIALGASRLRIACQLLIESVLLSLLGGILGLCFALLLVRLFVLAIQPLGIPYWVDWSMDATSVGYLFVICVASGILFGLAPALQMSKANVTDGLKETGRQASGGVRKRFLTSTLIVVEISLTVVLMVGAGLLVRSLLALQSVNMGFRTGNLLIATLTLSDAKHPSDAERIALTNRLSEQMKSAPDVESFTITSQIPGSGAERSTLELADRNTSDGNGRFPTVALTVIDAGYFRSLGLTMPGGREFSSADDAAGSPVAIVNQRFAAQYWPSEDSIGKRIRLGNRDWITVVGVSPTIRQTSLRRDVEALVYIPYRQFPQYTFSIIMRTRSSGISAARTLREEWNKLEPGLPAMNILTFEEYVDRFGLEARILSTLFSMFAMIGLVLSAVGIYAVTAYSVSQRTQEIGIRMALGATGADMVWLLLRSGLKQLATALPIGIVCALMVSRLFASVLFEVGPLDIVTFASIPILLTVIVLFACLIPAWRAARLNPLDALRIE